ncbi:MAG TPA: NfeD family protein [Blastocatellia bacterium]|nr:NfeD family protein [Blastocatellia bacterium]
MYLLTLHGIQTIPVVSFWLAVSAVVLFGLILLAFVLGLAHKARLAKLTIRMGGVIGSYGVVQTELSPAGTVLVHGALWNAKSRMRIARGADIRVVGLEGLILDVEPE